MAKITKKKKEMEKQTLNKEEKQLLLLCLKNHNPLMIKYIDLLDEILLDNNLVNTIREIVGNELQEKGFSTDWEPNDYGLKLENLIDKLGNLYKK
jgi:hypothetical protein